MSEQSRDNAKTTTSHNSKTTSNISEPPATPVSNAFEKVRSLFAFRPWTPSRPLDLITVPSTAPISSSSTLENNPKSKFPSITETTLSNPSITSVDPFTTAKADSSFSAPSTPQKTQKLGEYVPSSSPPKTVGHIPKKKQQISRPWQTPVRNREMLLSPDLGPSTESSSSRGTGQVSPTPSKVRFPEALYSSTPTKIQPPELSQQQPQKKQEAKAHQPSPSLPAAVKPWYSTSEHDRTTPAVDQVQTEKSRQSASQGKALQAVTSQNATSQDSNSRRMTPQHEFNSGKYLPQANLSSTVSQTPNKVTNSTKRTSQLIQPQKSTSKGLLPHTATTNSPQINDFSHNSPKTNPPSSNLQRLNEQEKELSIENASLGGRKSQGNDASQKLANVKSAAGPQSIDSRKGKQPSPNGRGSSVQSASSISPPATVNPIASTASKSPIALAVTNPMASVIQVSRADARNSPPQNTGLHNTSALNANANGAKPSTSLGNIQNSNVQNVSIQKPSVENPVEQSSPASIPPKTITHTVPSPRPLSRNSNNNSNNRSSGVYIFMFILIIIQI